MRHFLTQMESNEQSVFIVFDPKCSEVELKSSYEG